MSHYLKNIRLRLKNQFFIALCLVAFVSCRSYYDIVIDFHKELDNHNFKKAEEGLTHNRFLKKRRNQILLNLELGKVFHLQQQYDSSNYYFNKADLLMEEHSVGADISTSVLVNEAMTRYKGEDFERVLVNYYKALNYLYLNLNEDALVEAKRINLRLEELGDKQLMSGGRKYRSDAFAHTLQGFIYERMGDFNNAFIAYRNAYEVYEKNTANEYMGVQLPEQLKIDLINIADKSGLYAERDEYCSKFNLSFNTIRDTSKNQLLFIWENGLAPIKQQKDIVLFLVKGVGGNLMFSDEARTINIPFPLPEKQNDPKLSDLKVIRIAYPKYIDVPVFYNNLELNIGDQSYYPQMAENITYIAHQNLQERFLKELTLTISRLVVKKLAEAQLNKENEAAGALMGIAGALLEKADTRNWQSLPSYISYARIPVRKGENTLVLKLSGADQSTSDTVKYNAKTKLSIMNYTSLRHFSPVFIKN